MPSFFLCFFFDIFFLSKFWPVDCGLSMWKIMIPIYRLWLHGLYELYGPHCPLSPERPLNLITHTLVKFVADMAEYTNTMFCQIVSITIYLPMFYATVTMKQGGQTLCTSCSGSRILWHYIVNMWYHIYTQRIFTFVKLRLFADEPFIKWYVLYIQGIQHPISYWKSFGNI